MARAPHHDSGCPTLDANRVPSELVRWGGKRQGGGIAREDRFDSGSRLRLALCLATLLPLAGCHHKPPQVAHRSPPPITRRAASQPSSTTATTIPAPRPTSPTSPSFDDTNGPPTFTETGLASWYGPNYNRRAAADGTVYDQDGMTAAHRTLPMGSTVRVTNLATGQQVYVRITDRGPFAPGRILDLSEGAAKAIGLYRAGVGKVRVEAFAHTSADPPGHWCVQTGPFTKEHDARDLKTALLDRYRTAKIAEFQGPTGFWVRIDPAGHARSDALAIQDWIGNPDPYAAPYLVRID
jgi:rare lipoprotein A